MDPDLAAEWADRLTRHAQRLEDSTRKLTKYCYWHEIRPMATAADLQALAGILRKESANTSTQQRKRLYRVEEWKRGA